MPLLMTFAQSCRQQTFLSSHYMDDGSRNWGTEIELVSQVR